MKKVKILICTIITALLLSFVEVPIVFAEAGKSDFVDLTFTLGSKYYYSKSIKKNLDAAPLSINGYTMVPFRAILEELGYTIQWNNSTRTGVATQPGSTMTIQVNSVNATVNGVKKQMPVAPRIVNTRVFVPLRFISENSGANVVWDGATKTIYITRAGVYDTGKILFFEKKRDNRNNAYIYNGKEFKVIPMVNKEVINWFSYKGKVLLTIFDRTVNNNNFVIFRNDGFQVLINDFDIKDTFEYNNNLIIHGFDRSQKINMLYRFDGENLNLIEEDFCIGKYTIFGDKLVKLLVGNRGDDNPNRAHADL
jgi:hypothetical protein